MVASVRWDRVGRVALLLVLGLVLALYLGPAHSYWRTWRESKAKQAELHRLKRENERLLARRRALREPASLMREARRLGMVRQGERAFVIEGLPRG
jgi:cell division protein FtsB